MIKGSSKIIRIYFQFTTFLEELSAHGVISSSTVDTANKYIKMNADWFDRSDMRIKDYLYDYYGISGGATRANNYLSIMILMLLSVFVIQSIS